MPLTSFELEDENLAISCVEDTLLRIRNHPILVRLIGHDEKMPVSDWIQRIEIWWNN